MKKMEFKVTLTLLDGVRFADAKDYILEAVETWGEHRDPHLDFFDMYDKVKVVRLIRRQA
jgi:hypothetical protein